MFVMFVDFVVTDLVLNAIAVLLLLKNYSLNLISGFIEFY